MHHPKHIIPLALILLAIVAWRLSVTHQAGTRPFRQKALSKGAGASQLILTKKPTKPGPDNVFLREVHRHALETFEIESEQNAKSIQRIDCYIVQLDEMLTLSESQIASIRDQLREKSASLEIILTPSQRQIFQEHTLDHQRQRVEDQANAELRSFMRKYTLDASQQDQLFQVLVHYHQNYHPRMRAENSGSFRDAWPDSKEDAIARILYEDQRERYREGLRRWRQRR